MLDLAGESFSLFQWLERAAERVPHGTGSERHWASIGGSLTFNLVQRQKNLELLMNSTSQRSIDTNDAEPMPRINLR